MNIELILKSDVLDLLFEHRNKAYGAYMLRKFYENRLLKALGLMMTGVISFSAFTFLTGTNTGTGDVSFIETELGKISPSPKVPEPKPKPRMVNAATASPVKSRSNITIVDHLDSTKIPNDLINGTPSLSRGISISTGAETGVEGVPGGEGGDEPAKPAESLVDITKPMNNPEIMPQYPGGMEALRKFLVRNLKNPRDLDDGELISVKVMFVVGYDGNLQRFEVIQDGGSEFNNEVIRVLKKMPAWIPGKSKGQNVSVFYTIPVKFVPES